MVSGRQSAQQTAARWHIANTCWIECESLNQRAPRRRKDGAALALASAAAAQTESRTGNFLRRTWNLFAIRELFAA
jgi:hypothetical protein